jgi:DNA modification methylase
MAGWENAKYLHVDVNELKPAPRNARTHSKAQINKIANSVRRFGFTNPVLIDKGRNVVAGHGRIAAAKQLGMTEVPCVVLEDMSEAERRAYVLADNKLALDAGWDFEILAGELQGLIDLGFEVDLTGFSQPEVDLVIQEVQDSSTNREEPADYHPEPDPEPVSRHGDLWVLGRHFLACGDAKDPAVIERLMGGRKADMVFTDPPYNVRIAGNVCGLGRIKHREFSEASGEMSREQFTAFLAEAFAVAEKSCRDGAIAFTCMDWRHLGEVIAAGLFTELKNICVWSKTNGGMGAFYRSQHEMVLVWKVGTAAHTNTFGLGGKGRYRTNVWTYPGVNTFRSERMEELASHPTVKPVALVADAIRDVSNRGEIVLDIFGGSGTTLIAAEKTGRSARLIEIDPIYCDVIIRRWEKLTGKSVVLASTEETFETVKCDRLGDGHLQLVNQAA